MYKKIIQNTYLCLSNNVYNAMCFNPLLLRIRSPLKIMFLSPWLSSVLVGLKYFSLVELPVIK
jgi:uncharacterized protein YjfI (DUF2170 family)